MAFLQLKGFIYITLSEPTIFLDQYTRLQNKNFLAIDLDCNNICINFCSNKMNVVNSYPDSLEIWSNNEFCNTYKQQMFS